MYVYKLLVPVGVCRSADTGDAAAGHASYARQCSSTVFLRLFHLWHRRRSVVGGASAPTLRPSVTRQCHSRLVRTAYET